MDDHPDCGVQSKVTVNTTGQDSVYIIVDGWSFNSGPYEIAINPETLGLNEIDQNLYSIVPNPATNNIAINNYSGLVQIRDANGKILSSQVIELNQHIDISDFSSGFYFIELTTENESFIQKLIVQ